MLGYCNIVVVIECMLRIWESVLLGTNPQAECETCHTEKVTSVGFKPTPERLRPKSTSSMWKVPRRKSNLLRSRSTSSMWKLPSRKSDFGGIRTHARKTAALTQRLRPLGHEVTYSESGTRTLVCCVRGSYDNHLHQFGWLENSGIEPETSCMLSTRSTNWANPPSCDTCGIPVADSVADSSDWLSHWVIRLTWAASHQICAIHNLTSQLLRLLATAVAFTSVDCRLCHGHFHTATTTARS